MGASSHYTLCLPNKGYIAQECDARKDEKSMEAGSKKTIQIFHPLLHLPRRHLYLHRRSAHKNVKRFHVKHTGILSIIVVAFLLHLQHYKLPVCIQ